MTAAAWVAFVSGLITIVSAMTCGWLGVSAYLAGKRPLGVAILAAPVVFSLLLPLVLQLLPFGSSQQSLLLRNHLQLAALVLLPMTTVLALTMSKRYLPK
jgi:hypothetical protein